MELFSIRIQRTFQLVSTGIGTRQDVQARLPERDCREKDDLSERQAADYRNDGTTNQRAQYQPEHRLRGCAVGRFI